MQVCKYNHDIYLHKVCSGEKRDLVEETHQHFKTSTVEILKEMEGTMQSNQKAMQDSGNENSDHENTVIFITRTANSKFDAMSKEQARHNWRTH